jgi:hypothetical protein
MSGDRASDAQVAPKVKLENLFGGHPERVRGRSSAASCFSLRDSDVLHHWPPDAPQFTSIKNDVAEPAPA